MILWPHLPPHKAGAVGPGAPLKIKEALAALTRAKGPVCLTCLGLCERDERGLLETFGADIPPKHRLVEGTCATCGKNARVVRKVWSYQSLRRPL